MRGSFCFSVLVLASCLLFLAFSDSIDPVYPCPSQIYCHGPLLEAVQVSKIFKDDKTFVDMHLLRHPDEVFSDFMKLYDTWPVVENTSMRNTSRHDLWDFVMQNFAEPGVELQPVRPSDWVPRPAFINGIADPNLQAFASQVNEIWSHLAMEVSPNVSSQPELYSFIPVPNPVVIPGGRFREFYYWDSYWILKGLLLSEMFTTARGMIENLGTMVDTYGFVPNGGRIYYTRRSQPPMLTLMVADYLEATGDFDFLKEMVPRLSSEHEFFMANRSVKVTNKDTGKHYVLNQFRAPTTYPRPESFIEDYDAAMHLDDEASRKLFQNIASAAESGADFSSRWYYDPDDFQGGTKNLDTTDIVEVDLNAIMCKVEKTISQFYTYLNDSDNAEMYLGYASSRAIAIEELFWSNSAGMWQDWSISANDHRNNFYASYITPWWADCHGTLQGSISSDIETQVMQHLSDIGIFNYPGGVPTSLVKSGQQWDLPNIWAPLQYFMIEALSTGYFAPTRQAALALANKWVETTYIAFSDPRYGIFFEKYDAFLIGVPGGGGEYTEQTGFGWTNGMILYALNKFGGQLSSSTFSSNVQDSTADNKNNFDRGVLIWIGIGFFCFMLVVCAFVQYHLKKQRRSSPLTPADPINYSTI